MISDVVVPRVEFNALEDALKWSADGSIALNTAGQISILTPKHAKGDVKNGRDLFEITRLELDKLNSNALYNAEMMDESTGTLFTSLEQTVTKISWSPLHETISYLALLTTFHSVLVVKDGKLWRDLTTKDPITSQAQLDQQKTHCFGWIEAGGDLLLVEGLASGHIRTIEIEEIETRDYVKVTNLPIVQLRVFGSTIFAVSATNEIFKIEGSKVEQLKAADRFKVYDIYIQNESTVIFTTCNKISKIEGKNVVVTGETGLMTPTRIFPHSTGFVIVAQSSSVQLNSDLHPVVNDTVEPLIKKRISKWHARFNDFNTKKAALKIFGSDLNHSGNVLAFIYELEHDVPFKYQISSENVFKIAFVPLHNKLRNKGSSLSHFQEFKITGHQLDETTETTAPDYTVNLTTFISDHIQNDGEIATWSSQNLITGDKDGLIKKKYATLLLEYVTIKKMKLSNQFDKVVLNNLYLIAGKPVPEVITNVVINGGGFAEAFDFSTSQNPELMVSKTGNEWATCSLTFLPILTTQVKVDPVTERRFIDPVRDTFNDYGPLTKTILESGDVSIYSGCRLVVK